MASTSGFSPHPRISYANAAPTGAASEAEYLEIGLTETVDPEWVCAALNAALPDGLDVVAVAVAPPGALADLLTGSSWRIDLDGISTAALDAAVQRFLAAETAPVERMTKNGLRSFDARGAVLSLTASNDVRTDRATPRPGPHRPSGQTGRRLDGAGSFGPELVATAAAQDHAAAARHPDRRRAGDRRAALKPAQVVGPTSAVR